MTEGSWDTPLSAVQENHLLGHRLMTFNSAGIELMDIKWALTPAEVELLKEVKQH
jgi:hypothetical protein